MPVSGQKIQYAEKQDELPPVGEEEQTFIQQVTGAFLYYARTVDPTMLVALSTRVSDQTAPLCNLPWKRLHMCFWTTYVASYPDAILTYNKSSMVLAIHNNASYLSAPT